MRFVFISVLSIIFFTSTAFSQQDSDSTGHLTVLIRGMDNNDGQVMIALCNSSENYETQGNAFRGSQVKIDEQKSVYTFENIPKGEYAVKVFHDENSNEELDTNFLGIPSEYYGFSNNAKGSFDPASWEDAKFLFKTKVDTIVINLE